MILSQFLSQAEQNYYLREFLTATPFRPVIGNESSILNSDPTKGYIWFAKDSKKIYYSDGENFLSMGGNSGVYYSKSDITEGDESTDRIDFNYKILDIDGNEAVTDGNYKIPNTDDLIINEYTKAFYRVESVIKDPSNLLDNTIIKTVKIAIAGGGGGATGGGLSRFIFKDLDDGSTTKYFRSDAKEAILKFNLSSTILEGNSIIEMTYFVGTKEVFKNIEVQNFGDFTFDIAPYLSTMSKAAANIVKIKVIDIFGSVKEFYYSVYVLELLLNSEITDSILQAKNGVLDYYCVPSGGASLKDKKIVYDFYDKDGNIIPEKSLSVNVTSINSEIPVKLTFDIGVYGLKVYYTGRIENTNTWIPSNVKSYSVVSCGDDPLLVAFIPAYQVEQYTVLTISYMVAMNNPVNEKTQVSLIKNNVPSVVEINYNEITDWDIDFETIGTYDLEIIDSFNNKISFSGIQVLPYGGDVPTINSTQAELYLSATGRSNNEILSDNKNISERDKWTFKNYDCNFRNFSWGNINGWLRDEDNLSILKLNSGAKLEVNYEPFKTNIIEKGDLSGGLTLELDFKISGVTDFSQPLIYCLSHTDGNIQVGFQITGQESTMNTWLIKATGAVILEGDDEETQKYNTAIQGLTAKFIEDKRIHLTWVIQRNNTDYPMIFTYLNGIRSGITFYDRTDVMEQNSLDPAKIIIDSTHGTVDLYNIRVYKRPLNAKEVLDNYIATCGSIEERIDKNNSNKGLLGLSDEISVESIEAGGYTLSVPYIKITGGEGLFKNDDGDYVFNISDNEIRLPQAKKDYRLIKEMSFIDQNGKHPNYTYKSKYSADKTDIALDNFIYMYGQGTSSMEYPIKNLRIKSKAKDEEGKKIKFKVNSNDCPVDLICLKADYMESSGSHNTGTANLIYKLLTGLKYKTPAQEYYDNKNLGYEIVTTIRGYPVLVFYRPDEESVYEFIGKYNLNLDKATQEPFGFVCDPEKKPNSISEAKFGWAEEENTITSFAGTGIVNTIHCYEFKENSLDLSNFNNNSENDFETHFYEQDKDGIPNWAKSYESRYPESEMDDGWSDIDIASWFNLCKWVNSTSKNEATGQDLEQTYTGIDGTVYTKDTEEYRLAKFKKEFEEHFNLRFTTFYYVLTHVLLMIDSRAKNLMIATWDNQIWYPIFYDMDTMLGLNNYGYNKFGYDTEDTQVNIYNGQNSTLWNNFRECFRNEIRTMYNSMQKNGLTYQSLIDNYNISQANATNESVYNADSDYKYIDPFNEGYYDGLNGKFVTPGTKDYLYASQGNRSMHREWWVNNRLTYFNGMYLSDEFKSDRYEMRIYTPQAAGDNYTAVFEPTEEDFNSGKYYIKKEDGSFEIATGEYKQEDYYYFVKAPNALGESIAAVVPNNNFTLTPLHNQYLSVAYGGDNGVTIGPNFAEGNEELLISTPAGYRFNDTETYIYGGSTLKSLGDLSTQYLGAFKFPTGTTKLETLILGNKNNKYYNYNFSNLAIGKGAPYLKTLDITNCSGLAGRSQSLEYCQNIQNIYATGSGLTGIVLPEHGVIQELRLPDTLILLRIIDQPYLTKEKFTMGGYNSDIKQYTSNNYNSLLSIELEDVPNFDSYEMISNAKNLQKYSLKNVDWHMTNLEDIDFTNKTIKILEFLKSEQVKPKEDNRKSLTGTLNIPKYNGDDEDLLELYNSYWEFFPNLDFKFTDANIYNVTVYDDNENIIWTKKILGNTKITKEFFENGPKGRFVAPLKENTNDSEWNYHFKNIWYGTMGDSEIDPFEGSKEDGIYGWPIPQNLLITNDIILIPSYDKSKKKYKITYKNYDEGIIEEQEYEYGTLMKETIPTMIPYKPDDDNLNYNEIYAFMGYNTSKGAINALVFGNDYKVSREVVLYAVFEKSSVYENVHQEYFDYIDVEYVGDSINDPDIRISGVAVLPKDNLNLKGKITIPAFSPTGKPVIGIGYQNRSSNFRNKGCYPTHIFFEKDANGNSNIIYVGQEAFGDTTINNLTYFEFTDSLRVICKSAFKKAPLTNYNISSKNLKIIGYEAFNQAFKSEEPVTLFISPSVHHMDYYAISNPSLYKGSTIQVGNSDEPSALVFTDKFEKKASNGDERIRANADTFYLVFYSEYYDQDDLNEVIYNETTLFDCIGKHFINPAIY